MALMRHKMSCSNARNDSHQLPARQGRFAREVFSLRLKPFNDRSSA